MQPSPAPADYKLLRDGAVAALQILYLDVTLLRRLVCSSEANKRPSTCVNGECIVVGEIGESCRNPHVAATMSVVFKKTSGKVCLLYLCPVPLSPAHSLTQLLICAFGKSRFHLGLTVLLDVKLFLAILCKVETPFHHVVQSSRSNTCC